jgi:hypothetical protein
MNVRIYKIKDWKIYRNEGTKKYSGMFGTKEYKMSVGRKQRIKNTKFKEMSVDIKQMIEKHINFIRMSLKHRNIRTCLFLHSSEYVLARSSLHSHVGKFSKSLKWMFYFFIS